MEINYLKMQEDLENMKVTIVTNSNGVSMKYQNGIVIQWGLLQNSAKGFANIYFPIPFVDNNYNMQLTNKYYPGGGNSATTILLTAHYGQNGTSCLVYFRDKDGVSSTNSNLLCNWFAIGYWK